MTTSAEDLMTLAGDFEARGRQDWEVLVAQVLGRGRDEEHQVAPEDAAEALVTALDGGLRTEGLYLRRDRALGLPGRMPFTRGRAVRDASIPWDVRQLHDDPDPARSRRAVLEDLEHGVTSVWVHVGEEGVAPGDLAEVLGDVLLDLAPVAVSSFTDQTGAARALLEVVGERPSAGGSLGLDPVGAALRTGTAPDLAPLGDLVRAVSGRPRWKALAVDTRVLHDAGAGEVDALAAGVATAVAYLRHLEAEGLGPAEVAPLLEFRVPATADQFLTAATLRALRRVWARVAEACGVPAADRGVPTHAVTSLRMVSRDEPFVNVLRSTLAAFGASVGGADAVTVLPHDTVAGLPERFSRRLARNTQLLLAEESNVGRVTDPGGGSWYLESLTDDVAAAVWRRFQEIERAGGVLDALRAGKLHGWVEEAVTERAHLVATRARPLTGVSTFPDLAGVVPERRPRPVLEVGEGALAPRRDAAVFEALRDRARSLGSPAVTVQALGSPAESGARESFVTSLLAAGGLARTEEVRPVAVIASSPAGYAEHAAAAVEELRAAGATHVLVAGRSSELGEGAGGVDGEVYDGVDVVAFLDGVLERLGAPAEGRTR